MNRIEMYKKNYVYDEFSDYIYYPKDVKTLRENVKNIEHLTDLDISNLYSDYSAAVWAAGWISMNVCYFTDFNKWLYSGKDSHAEYYPPEWYNEVNT